IIPGFGALVTRCISSTYDEERGVITAPCRELSFNGDIVFDDGLIASSIARRNGVRYTEAVRIVADEVAAMRAQMDFDGQFAVGRLGRFVKTSDTITFESEQSEYHLKDIVLKEQSAEMPAEKAEEIKVVPILSRFSATASRIAAAIAILITIGFTLYNPAVVGEGVMKASFMPDLRLSLAPKVEAVVDDLTESTERQSDDIVVDAESAEEAIAEEATEESIAPAEEVAADVETLGARSDNEYYLIVASLPTTELAEQFIADNSLKGAKILEADGRYRVSVKAGNSYSEAADQDLMDRFAGSWVFRSNP
ncbi:MAG: hypothetical protein HDS75_03990, partial [Bacteroidales bacterium]|nr:hypothetical protein [Bacteroidales bacterium]